MTGYEKSSFTEDDLRQMVLRLAHEIRNPLATIQSAVQLLEHLSKPEGEILEYYQSIYVEVTRIDRVVRDMQRFVRLDVHTATAITITDAIGAAAEVATNGSPVFGAVLDVIGGPKATVLMDQDQLETAITELLSNALRFNEEPYKVQVSWQKIDGGYIQIDVRDHGPGIPKHQVDAIFRPFFSSSTQGTGLGLNIVSRTCQIAGGRLEWRNVDDGGACFSMILPILPED